MRRCGMPLAQLVTTVEYIDGVRSAGSFETWWCSMVHIGLAGCAMNACMIMRTASRSYFRRSRARSCVAMGCADELQLLRCLRLERGAARKPSDASASGCRRAEMGTGSMGPS